jgi:hypothetical protein
LRLPKGRPIHGDTYGLLYCVVRASDYGVEGTTITENKLENVGKEAVTA